MRAGCRGRVHDPGCDGPRRIGPGGPRAARCPCAARHPGRGGAARPPIFTAAELARRHRALGVKLSHPEAVALIADEMLVAARRDMPYEEIIEMAGQLLTTDDVMPGVAGMVSLVSVEGCFAEGTKM